MLTGKQFNNKTNEKIIKKKCVQNFNGLKEVLFYMK